MQTWTNTFFVELTHELDCGTSTLLEYQNQNWDNNHDKIKLTQVQVKGIPPVALFGLLVMFIKSTTMHKLFPNPHLQTWKIGQYKVEDVIILGQSRMIIFLILENV